MTKEDLRERLTSFSVRIVKMVDAMPQRLSCIAIAKQIVRSGTSPSANYRAACLAKSDKDFVNKLKMVEEELDETNHWLEIIMRCGMLPVSKMDSLYKEKSGTFEYNIKIHNNHKGANQGRRKQQAE